MDPEQQSSKVAQKLEELRVYADTLAANRAKRTWAHVCAFVAYVLFLAAGVGLLVHTLVIPVELRTIAPYAVAVVLLFAALLVSVGAFGEGKAK